MLTLLFQCDYSFLSMPTEKVKYVFGAQRQNIAKPLCCVTINHFLEHCSEVNAMAKSTEIKLMEEILILRSYIEFPDWTREKRANFLQVSEAHVSRVLNNVTQCDTLKQRVKRHKESLRLIKQIEKRLYDWSKVMNKKKPNKLPNDWRNTFK